MKRKMLLQLVTALWLALLCQATLFAQSDLGSILGTVRDPSGAVVPNAQVSIVKEDTNFKRSMPTNDAGDYNFALVAPGDYTVSAEMAGFKKYLQAHVQLTARQIMRMDITLLVGQTAETVTVTAEVTPVNSESVTISEGYAPAQLKNFNRPLVMDRGTAQLIGNWSLQSIGVGGGQWKFNGGRSDQVRVTQDGRVGFALFGIPMTMIQELKMVTVNANAEYVMPGTVSVTSKSGTNAFHADAEYILRHPRLNAVGPNYSPRTPARGSYDSSFIGGGPIIIPKVYNGKDRTWWTATYERSMSMDYQWPPIINVPTVRMRTGDFSQLRDGAGNLIPIYDPLTGQQFANNIIPANRINSVSAKIRDLYPLPNRNLSTPDDPFQNHIGGIVDPIGHQFYSFNNFFMRFDQKISSKDTFNFNYKLNRQVARFDTGASGFAKVVGLWYAVQSQSIPAYAFAETHIFSPTIVNEARFAFDGFTQPSGTDTQGQAILQQFGITGIDPNLNFTGAPNIVPAGMAGLGQVYADSTLLEHRFSYLDNLTWVKGKHTIKSGFNYTRMADSNVGTAGGNAFGTFNFTGRLTQSPTGIGGHSWADLLLGFPDTTVRFTPRPASLPFNYLFGAYIQDDWKVTPRLTINFGVRYDVEGSPVDRAGLFYSFDPKNGALVFPTAYAMNHVSPLFNTDIPLELASAAGLPPNLIPVDKNNFVPRLGFAFRPFNDATTVIRAAYGIYTTGKLGTILSGGAPAAFLNTSGPFALSETFTNIVPAGGGQPTLSFPSPFLPVGQGTAASSYTASFVTGQYHDPYMQQWNLSIEREFFKTAFRVSYVGSKSTNLRWSRNINQVPASTIPFDISSCGEQGLRPNPTCRRNYYGFSSVNMTDGGGNDIYHSLQLEFTRPMAHGFQMHGGWIWAKQITDVEESLYMGSAVGIDPYNRNYNRGDTNFVLKHRFQFDFTWVLPVGRGQKYLSSAPGIVNQLLGGWVFTGWQTITTGPPFSIIYSGVSDPSGTGQFSGRADRIGSGVVSNPTQNNWFDPTAFVAPPCGPADPAYPNVACMPIGRFGNSGRNILYGPGPLVYTATGTNSMFTVHKNFPIYKERLNLRVSAYISDPFNSNYLLPPFPPWSGGGNNISDANVGRQSRFGSRAIGIGSKLEF